MEQPISEAKERLSLCRALTLFFPTEKSDSSWLKAVHINAARKTEAVLLFVDKGGVADFTSFQTKIKAELVHRKAIDSSASFCTMVAQRNTWWRAQDSKPPLSIEGLHFVMKCLKMLAFTFDVFFHSRLLCLLYASKPRV
jgi:hypothetical protein